MAYLIAILVFLGLFAGFLLLTYIEKKRGARLFSDARASLDASVMKGLAAGRSMDPVAFTLRGVRFVGSHIGHDIANVTWAGVRMLERTLALTVRNLRHMRHHGAAPKPIGPSTFEKRSLSISENSSPETTPGEVQ